MAKKLGKALLLTAVASAAAGATLYLLKKKETPILSDETEDEDLDDYDFWEDEESAPVESESEEAPEAKTPAEETPVEDVPAEEAPVEKAPVEEAPAEETPVEEAPVEEAPAEVPVGEPVVETEEFFGDEEDEDFSFAENLKKASDSQDQYPEEGSLNEVFLDETSGEGSDAPTQS